MDVALYKINIIIIKQNAKLETLVSPQPLRTYGANYLFLYENYNEGAFKSALKSLYFNQYFNCCSEICELTLCDCALFLNTV